MKTTYTVENTYSTEINEMTGSTHRTPEAALKAAEKREGCGWIVLDSDENRWDWNGNVAYISEPAPIAGDLAILERNKIDAKQALINKADDVLTLLLAVMWTAGWSSPEIWDDADIYAIESAVEDAAISADNVKEIIEAIDSVDYDELKTLEQLATRVASDFASAVVSRVRWSQANPDGIWVPESGYYGIDL